MPANKIAFGAPQLAAGLPLTTGTYYFVHSVTGSDGNVGNRPERALATLAKALTLATAGKGDVIVLLPFHAEAVTATNLALSKSGVTVFGLGQGASRPVFTYGAAAATITITGAGCSFRNCHFVANFLDVAAAFSVAAKDFVIDGCSFIDTSAVLNFLSCVVTSSTNNASDGLTFTNNHVNSLPTTDGAVVSILANQDRINLSDNVVSKAATNDAGHFVTLSSKVILAARIQRNVLTVVGSAGAAVGVFGTGSATTCSGIVSDNYVASLDTTTALLFTAGTKLTFIQNFMTGAADASGTLYPAADNPA